MAGVWTFEWAGAAAHMAQAFAGQCASSAVRLLLAFGSSYSLIELAATLAIAAAFTLAGRRAGRAVPWRVLRRALLPRRIWRSASGRADAGLMLFNIFLAGLMFGWAILSYQQISGWTGEALTAALGRSPMLGWPPLLTGAIATLALYLAYELAYFADHYLSHKWPLLWQFHAVHHSAESLSLATNFRVHPVDTIVFYNLVALVTGLTGGVIGFLFGPAAAALTIGGSNVLLLASAVLLTHLHHSHFWIRFGGRWGCLLLSPAHHQIHHSADPAHYDRNFGNSLAIFDQLFGTLHVPAARREPLTLGVTDLGYDPHKVSASLLMPFAGAARIARRAVRGRLRIGGLPGRTLDAA